MGMQFESLSLQKVYRKPSPRSMRGVLKYAYMIALYGAFLYFVWFIKSWDLDVRILATALVIFFGAFYLYIYLQIIRMHLVTSPEGIAYFGMGYRLFTAWENIAGIGVRDQRTGLELHQPAPLFEIKTILRFLVSSYATNFIPISLVIEDWQHSTLGEDIRHYAPRLFRRELFSDN